MRKLHRTLCEAIVQSCQRIIEEKRPADKVIEQTLKSNRRWGAHDRRWIAEHTYEIIRWYRQLAEPLEREKTPMWLVLAALLSLESYALPDWPEWRDFDKERWHKIAQRLQYQRAYRLSIPDWLDTLGAESIGAELWEREMEASNKPALIVLRVNTLKTHREAVLSQLRTEGIAAHVVPHIPDAIVLDKRIVIHQHALFQEGLIEIQDGGSQAISLFANPKPSTLVVDACAGAGGKTLHMAALMKNKGKIIVYDPEPWKIEELRKRARRANAQNIEYRNFQDTNTFSTYTGKADLVLVDAPCSGTGVFKRNPDTKWKLQPTTIEVLTEIQRSVLDTYARLVRPKGTLIYATCSLLPIENQQQVQFFLSKHLDFALVEEKQLFPSEGFDGFYMAKMIRNV